MITLMILNESAWNSAISFCKLVMLTKEMAKRNGNGSGSADDSGAGDRNLERGR